MWSSRVLELLHEAPSAGLAATNQETDPTDIKEGTSIVRSLADCQACGPAGVASSSIHQFCADENSTALQRNRPVEDSFPCYEESDHTYALGQAVLSKKHALQSNGSSH